MVTSNFHNDTAIIGHNKWVRVMFWHTLCGIYLWEFITTLDYEWRVIRGRSPYRWSIWIYSLTRITGLVGVLLSIVYMDVTTPINCQLWILFELFFSYLSFATASLLIVLRVIAIWNRNQIAIAMAFGTWGINLAILILGIVRERSAWAPSELTCLVPNTEGNTISLISMAVTDVVLLFAILVGLLRIRHHSGTTFGMTHFLWKQGIIWASLSVVVEVPPAVLILFNVNYQLKIIFQFSAMVIMTIAATRMYRSLVDFASRSSGACVLLHLKTKKPHAPPTPIEIEVYTTINQHRAPQVGDNDSPVNTEEGTHKKQNRSGVYEDIEQQRATETP